MYRTIDTKFWTDPAIRRLQPPAKLMLLYLITNPQAHVGGIYVIADATICHDTGLKAEALAAIFDTLSRPKTQQDQFGLVMRDRDLELVWVVSMLKYQGRGQKILKSVSKHLKTLHNSLLIRHFVEMYPGVKRYYRDTLCDTPSRVRPELAGVATQEQEQEQEITSSNEDVRCEGNGRAQGEAPKEKVNGRKVNEPGGTRKQASGDHHELIRSFRDGWKARYHADYRFIDGKDGKHVKWLLDAVHRDLGQAKAIVSAYLANDDDWLAEQRHPIGILVSQFNRFQVLDAPDPLEAMLERARASFPGGKP